MSGNGSQPDETPWAGNADGPAAELLGLMAEDLVFVMKFLGESQNRLQTHFQTFILKELAGRGIDQDSHPLITGFAEVHALMMRDFVFSGVALSRQFRIEEIERLLGDASSLLRVDIWDELRRHIDVAEAQFAAQVPMMEERLETYRPPGERSRA